MARPVTSGFAKKTAAAAKPSRLVTSPEKPISPPRPRNLIPSELRTFCKAMAAPASAGNKSAARFKWASSRTQLRRSQFIRQQTSENSGKAKFAPRGNFEKGRGKDPARGGRPAEGD